MENALIHALALEVTPDVADDILDDMEVNAGEIDGHVTVFGVGFEERQGEGMRSMKGKRNGKRVGSPAASAKT